MRRLSLSVLLSAVLLVGLGVAPVGAAPRQLTGDRINLLAGPSQSYPASTPFYIKQGHGLSPSLGDKVIGMFSFVLEVDGALRAVDFRSTEKAADHVVVKWWNFNFPNGMTGTHDFTGHWLGPCGTPNTPDCNGLPQYTIVELLNITVTVTFT